MRGLLIDGVVGTLGPVAEPYLQSFPTADEFFPLLLTGKLTLAEVYWRTTRGKLDASAASATRSIARMRPILRWPSRICRQRWPGAPAAATSE